MSDDRSAGGGEAGGVKVVDRRRFRPDGSPVESGSPEAAPGARAAPEPADPTTPAHEPSGPDARDEKLAEQARRIDELTRAYAALVEDNKGFRGRLERERTRALEAERAGVAQALLESADDLERALSAVSGAGEAGGQALRTLAEGVRLSLVGLHQRIAALGAERISVTGQRFDPRVAEAVDAVPVADVAQDDVVLHEVRAGWKIGDRILRPARVRVGRLARA